MLAALHSGNDSSRDMYLRCIRKFEEVYRRDPHCHCSDDAIYAQAQLLEESAQKFGIARDYSEAARVYRFLARDYPSSPHVRDALQRLGDLTAGPLKNDRASREAYEKLRAKHPNFRSSPSPGENPPPSVSEPKAGVQALIPDKAPPDHVTVHNIRHWTTHDYTRIIIDMEGEARYERTRLSNPHRIYFDIFNARVSSDLLSRTFHVGDQFLKRVRVGQNRSDLVRVVLDFEAIHDYTILELHDPFRIVVDIFGEKPLAKSQGSSAPRTSDTAAAQKADSGSGTSPAARKEPDQQNQGPTNTAPTGSKAAEAIGSSARDPVRASSANAAQARKERALEARTAVADGGLAGERGVPLPKTAAPTSGGKRTLTRALGLKIGRIVIDPGHGGHDTGTIGRNGLAEKDLVLHIAKQLRDLLEEKLSAEVILTREDDTFVPLEERTAIANQATADLFISIHANSSASRNISGPETYFLSFARTEAEREVAARENATTIRSVSELQSLVQKIAQADKSAESRELAAMIQRKLYSGAKQLFPGSRNRGVRSAPFVVLIGANMPSVLAEVAFISNPRDEKTLKQGENQRLLATAIFSGIEGYMKTLGLDVAQNRATGP